MKMLKEESLWNGDIIKVTFKGNKTQKYVYGKNGSSSIYVLIPIVRERKVVIKKDGSRGTLIEALISQGALGIERVGTVREG